MRWATLIPAIMPVLAMAQEGEPTIAGAWFDGGGNEVNLPGKLVAYEHLTPGARPVADILTLFREACLTVAVGTNAAKPAINARSDWGFRFRDRDAGTAAGARLDGWQAGDVSITSQPRTWPLAECNVLAARQAQENMTSIVASLTSVIGVQPDKRYRARAADGRSLVGESARWSVSGPDGAPRKVYASSYLDRNGAYALHLGLTEARAQ